MTINLVSAILFLYLSYSNFMLNEYQKLKSNLKIPFVSYKLEKLI